jgi:cellulose biosynthesis protein BcsQ
MFNNKGGVGKTTLTCNIASFFATRQKRRVLVVDCDPQCNATQLVLGQENATQYYWYGNVPEPVTTIKDILQPIEDGDSQISDAVVPFRSSTNRFNVDLIPGHPGFSVIEDRLGAAWHELKGGDLGGIRKTNWNSFLCRKLSNSYDLVFFDLGPSLGSINRSVLLGCDNFVTPMGTDIFSILGVRNIATWLASWIQIYENSLRLCEERTPGRLNDFHIDGKVSIRTGFAGYTMQQYITKSKQGERRPTKAYEDIISSVPTEIERSLSSFFAPNLNASSAKLGDVPHLYSLIPLAQSVSAPLLDLRGADGIVGSQYKQVEEYRAILERIATRLEHNLIFS